MKAQFLLLWGVVVLTSCSVLKKEDPDKPIRDFLFSLEKDLKASDDVILRHFHVTQSNEALLALIRILQNTDSVIVCEGRISEGTIHQLGTDLTVTVPVVFRVKNQASNDWAPDTLAMKLVPFQGTFVVNQLDGEIFYRTFSIIRGRHIWEVGEELALKARERFYETAHQLETKFDSVVWFTTYHGRDYYYVVKGSWDNSFLKHPGTFWRDSLTNMGLVTADGSIVVPLDYELISGPGIPGADLVEIRKDNLQGYYDLLAGKEIVPPEYRLILPYVKDGAFALALRDTVFGWIDTHFAFHSGFPTPKSEKYMREFQFLEQSVTIGPKDFCVLEIPSPEEAGNGIIIPPSYLAHYGLFDIIIGNINASPSLMNGWLEYAETRETRVESLTDRIFALVTGFRKRYLEGREEFYESNRLVFLDNKLDTLRVASIEGKSASFYRVDSSLFEVRTPHSYWFMEYDASLEANLFNHTYFSIADGAITPLQSKRLFPETQYVRLDSSYLTGDFIIYDTDSLSHFLSEKTITYMRNEIYASYGYQFPDSAEVELFRYRKFKNEQVTSELSELEPLFSDIDRHNIAFLNRVLAAMKPLNL